MRSLLMRICAKLSCRSSLDMRLADKFAEILILNFLHDGTILSYCLFFDFDTLKSLLCSIRNDLQSITELAAFSAFLCVKHTNLAEFSLKSIQTNLVESKLEIIVEAECSSRIVV